MALTSPSSSIPSYVLDCARQYPAGNQFHRHPTVLTPPTLDNFGQPVALVPSGSEIYLTSTTDITTNPAWLNGVKPDSNGKTNGATSCAIVVNDHGSGLVDAFDMYFYSFNKGNTVLGQVIGDHVSDWEHNMVWFENGLPQAMWFSQYSFGEAFTYGAVEKHGQRPISYSAVSSHANYAITRTHDHTIPGLNLPFNLVLDDHTDAGTLWDPTQNAYTYSYNAAANVYTPYIAGTPTNWLYFTGAWWRPAVPVGDPR
ncbi:hypothetical protein MMC13_002108 [Lambiella insularis]|nr:hypothetical protein [Lambiella insularis]